MGAFMPPQHRPSPGSGRGRDAASPSLTHRAATAWSAATAAELLVRVPRAAPRVHCLTNPVALGLSANVLLAAGAVPSMTPDPPARRRLRRHERALVVNLGMLEPAREAAILAAVAAAHELGRPWLLDPVKVERSPARLAFARRAAPAGRRPSIRGNAQRDRGAGRHGNGPTSPGHGAGIVAAHRARSIWSPTATRSVRARQRQPADGPGHRHGLRRLGPGRRLPRRRAGRLRGRSPRHSWSWASPASSRPSAPAAPAASPSSFLDALYAARRRHPGPRARLAMRPRPRPAPLCRARPGALPAAALGRLAAAAARGGATLFQLRDKRRRRDASSSEARARSGGAGAVRRAAAGQRPGRRGAGRRRRRRACRPGRHGAGGCPPAPRRRTRSWASPCTMPEEAGADVRRAPTMPAAAPSSPPEQGPGDPPLGPDGLGPGLLGHLRRHLPGLPGLRHRRHRPCNAAAVIAAGADGVAVISRHLHGRRRRGRDPPPAPAVDAALAAKAAP